MFTVILIMLAGICAGCFFRYRKIPFAGSAVNILIRVLLFLLGVEVGGDDRIVENIAPLGAEAAAIAAAGTAGSCLLALALWHVAKGERPEEGRRLPRTPLGLLREMKGSLIIVMFFILGIIAGRTGLLQIDRAGFDISFAALALLMFFVGVGVGGDMGALRGLRTLSPRLLLLPAATIFGTLAGCALLGAVLPGRALPDVLAVGSGFGYYSLSSIFITEYRGAELGTVALLANIFRELITLLGAPLLLKLAGPLAPISSGGATSMDTTLPVITEISGKEFAILSIYHGFIVDFSVPFLVTLFCRL